MRYLLAAALPVASMLAAPPARAEQGAANQTLAFAVPPMVLVGSAGGGGGPVAHAPSGFFVGADGGAAIMTEIASDPARAAAAFDVRFGYAFRAGLALQVRFDDLGVSAPAPGQAGPLMLASVGARYSVPFVVMPFVEAHLGTIFDASRASLGSVVGVGLSLPILRHLLIDLAVHDVIADVDGDVRHIVLLGLGLSVGFSR